MFITCEDRALDNKVLSLIRPLCKGNALKDDISHHAELHIEPEARRIKIGDL